LSQKGTVLEHPERGAAPGIYGFEYHMTPTIKSMTIAASSMATKRGMVSAPIYLVGSCGAHLDTIRDRTHQGQADGIAAAF
jgi:hypothetical protein